AALVSGAEGAQIKASDEAIRNADGPGPYLMLASTLEGDSVVNLKREKVGDIKGIMLDVQRGNIAYAVLSVGGFLGIGDKLFAVPWFALTLDADHHNFCLDIDKDRLKNAPGFNKDSWPDAADRSLATEVHAYFKARPYWER
ncbi:MAG TPA: PRC-barrel domain-containing protein, partial [Moraxellaceae bacterium]